ncbi:chromosome partitioning protein ParA [Leptolyngbya sp. 'hensonii']|uniref:ROK family protein n=1 Tax=Leptolyngbya sp. 'hensonii' TaxID=1922337 RepID=UPI0009501D9A|nr:ROK family protein [Leptolyngbya sp. 'hensonii']OLP15664.1 chromosome partitioning protein ParA [Leptolyngbya sp. 'hensonii']
MTQVEHSLRTLAVDIGGSGIKVMVLDSKGNPLTERARLDTPEPATPASVLAVINQLLPSHGDFDRVSVGFPGVIRAGVVYTAVNLHPDWVGFDLTTTLGTQLGRPVRVINDADMQGLGVISGQGVELVMTLGTGVGSGLFVDGQLVPNLELGHHPFRRGQTYEEQLGREALNDIGKERWNRRLQKAIGLLQNLFNYDRLYIGGGNTKKITLDLPPDVTIVPNIAGLLGGIALWRDQPSSPVPETGAPKQQPSDH